MATINNVLFQVEVKPVAMPKGWNLTSDVEENREVDVATLANLILEGSAHTEPLHGWYQAPSEVGAKPKACAMGAALFARYGHRWSESGYTTYQEMFEEALGWSPSKVIYPMFNTLVRTQGIETSMKNNLQSVVIELNDTYNWPREKIAALLLEAYKCQQIELMAERLIAEDVVSSGDLDGGQESIGTILQPQVIEPSFVG